MYSIRKAGKSDAAALSWLAEATFRETFGGMNAAPNMEAHCRDNFSEALQAEEIADPHMVTLLAEQGVELLGFAQLRWHEAPSFVQGNLPGEIQRLYVASKWHGKGVAQALTTASFEQIRARGSDVVWLGVWERNPRAIAFYTKLGFVERGEHVFLLGDDPQRDIVMSRSVYAITQNE